MTTLRLHPVADSVFVNICKSLFDEESKRIVAVSANNVGTTFIVIPLVCERGRHEMRDS